MLQDVIHPVIHPPEQQQQQQQQQQQLPIENITSPINAQMFEFDQDLFPEALQNSEVSSCSNCYDDNSSYTTNISFSSFPADVKFNPNTTTTTTTTTNNNNNNINVDTITNNNLSIIFDSQEDTENNIAASINFLTSQTTFSVPPFITTQEDQFDLSSLQSQIPINDVGNVNAFTFSPDPGIQLAGAPLAPSVFEDDCLPNLPSYVSLDPSSPSCSFLDPTIAPFLPGGNLNPGLSGDATGIFAGGILMAGSDLQPHELEFQGDNGGIFGTDPYSSGEIQDKEYQSCKLKTINTDNQQLVNGGGGTNSPLASEISNLEESSYKVGRLSVEERKEKIHRYMKKRNERNFSKKIKYACRKTLADSRPRVRGRFAKNDDFGETARTSGSNQDDEDDEVVGKEEDDMVDSSDIFAHISGVNSFKCNYPLQSWI